MTKRYVLAAWLNIVAQASALHTATLTVNTYEWLQTGLDAVKRNTRHVRHLTVDAWAPANTAVADIRRALSEMLMLYNLATLRVDNYSHENDGVCNFKPVLTDSEVCSMRRTAGLSAVHVEWARPE